MSETLLVQRIKPHYCGNRALCGKSMKLGTHLYDTYRCKFSYSAISGSVLGGAWQAFLENGCHHCSAISDKTSHFGTNLHLASKNSLLQYNSGSALGGGAWQHFLKMAATIARTYAIS